MAQAPGKGKQTAHDESPPGLGPRGDSTCTPNVQVRARTVGCTPSAQDETLLYRTFLPWGASIQSNWKESCGATTGGRTCRTNLKKNFVSGEKFESLPDGQATSGTSQLPSIHYGRSTSPVQLLAFHPAAEATYTALINLTSDLRFRQ